MDNIGKRMYRNLGDDTKAKISQSLRGRCKSASHIQAISQGMSNYWKTIPVKPDDTQVTRQKKRGNNPLSFHSPLIYSIIKGGNCSLQSTFPTRIKE